MEMYEPPVELSTKALVPIDLFLSGESSSSDHGFTVFRSNVARTNKRRWRVCWLQSKTGFSGEDDAQMHAPTWMAGSA